MSAAMMHRFTATVASLLVFTACPGDSSPTSETTGETTVAESTETSAGSGTTSEQPTTGGSSDSGVDPTSGAPDTTGGSTGTTGETGTTGAIDDTGGSSDGSDGSDGTDTGGSSGTEAGETSSGESSEGGESSTGECSELGAAAEMTAMELAAAVEGVLFGSESDYPWTVVTLACVGPVTADNVKELLAPVYVPHDDLPLADRVVEVRSFTEFFDKLTVPQDWWDDYYYEQAEKYKPIRQILEDNLTDLQVFRLGEQSGNNLSGQIDVYVLGRSGEDIVGIATIAVET